MSEEKEDSAFEWTIEVDEFTKSKKFESEIFSQRGGDWRLLCYPNGTTSDKGYIGIFLKCIKLPPNVQKLHINYRLHVGDDRRSTVYTFVKNSHNGFPRFTKFRDNWTSLKLKAEILNTLIQNEAGIQWKINGWLFNLFKETANTKAFRSPVFEMHGGTWTLHCYPNGKSVSSNGYISLYLKCIELPSNITKMPVNYRLKAIEPNEEKTTDAIFENNGVWGYEQFTKFENDWTSLTLEAEIIEPLKENEGWINWKIQGWLLREFISSKSKTFSSPNFEMCGMKMELQCYPRCRNKKSKTNFDVVFKDIDTAITVKFALECPEANYKHYNEKEITMNQAKISFTSIFPSSVFTKHESVTFKFKILSTMTINKSLQQIQFRYNTQEIISETIKNEFVFEGKQCIMHCGLENVGLQIRGFQGAVYRKIESKDIDVSDARIVDEEKVNDEGKFDVFYKADLLKNISYITISCDIVSISGMQRRFFEQLISKDSTIKSQSVEVRKLRDLKQSQDSKIQSLKQELDLSRSEVEKIKQETDEYRLKAIPSSDYELNEDEKMISDNEDDALYKKHNDIMNKWNETTLRLKEISLNNNNTAPNEEEKKDEKQKEWDMTELYEHYLRCNEIIEQQDERLSQVQSNEYLIELLNHQSKISKLIKERESKLPLQEEEIDKHKNQYDGLKEERINVKNEFIELAQKYNQLIEKESATCKQFKQIQHDKSQNDKNVQTLKSSLNSCLHVIRLYNDFMDNNNEYIDKINSNFKSQWNQFERNWTEWDAKQIITWFKYKTSKMDTNHIKWENAQQQIASKNLSGKSLSKFNDLTFNLIGIKDFEIVNHLISHIEILKMKYQENNQSKYQENKQNENELNIKIPDRYICHITKQIMKEPVMAFDGYFYEKTAIESYLKINKKSPMTGANADYTGVFPKHSLKQEIEKFIKDNNIDLDVLYKGETEDEYQENGDELPDGWFEATTDDGRTYYYNVETQESQWIKPQHNIYRY